MTVRTTRLGGTDWVNGEVLDAPDLNDTVMASINESGWNKIKIGTAGVNISNGLIKHSTTVWETEGAVTTDGGSTWSAGGYGQISSENIATASGATAISTHQTDGSSAYTTDSGTTWQASTTQPANITQGLAVSLASTTIGVLTGNASAGVNAWYTTDSGNNWTQATTGPSGTNYVATVAMASTTVGYAIDTAGNIWKTTDGGINWTDTTDNTTTTAGQMIAVDTDTVLYTDYDTMTLYKYVNSTNTVTTLLGGTINGTTDSTSNFVLATNGNYYFIFAAGTGNSISNMVLLRYDGTDVWQKGLSIHLRGNPENVMRTLALQFAVFSTLIEGAANVLHFNLGGHIMTIDFTK